MLQKMIKKNNNIEGYSEEPFIKAKQKLLKELKNELKEYKAKKIQDGKHSIDAYHQLLEKEIARAEKDLAFLNENY
jgi:hypothetical protein